MSKGIFITGTGTDVGKTYVTGLIVKKLRASGLNAGYYKPALSGAEWIDGELVPGDCQFVTHTAGLNIAPAKLTSYMYKTAVSPHLAAQLDRRPIEAETILADFSKFTRCHDYLTVEGCGGIICPLRLDDTVLIQTDVIKLLKLDLLIVAPSGLGAINSAVLTAHYAQSLGLTVKGFILNHYDRTNFLHQDNKKVITQLTKLPVVACVTSQAADLAIDTAVLCGLYKEV
ncbi:dethiobiotin synthase [Sporomusa acidovorans]|uniref:ATP-dependent dethiobiotin synthetase BioD n=1 Tax=Sporomusa acidovorans (strain ATCC 49682 / DSM 3132 / Mol) TaxID=1123286 RepID=A0ABZ3J5F5_SPOA4|nr:dethiobiotin synthase [Sporomusa acidovorans]OZC15381.1 ATP-dependent dethiobiotin synthetase BioD 1 [Sporomusa acidovorans DSM 3132]SDF13763.1 dethiobiotin synthetase [Sporomusa acidovorans]